LVILFVGFVTADLYLHNPRGSENRLNEANTNRNNANRLFDSQNNGQGGYCYGPEMGYYEGSQLMIQWTNQHGCNNEKLYCNLVIQYMCSSSTDPADMIRDGATTNTIPNTPFGANTTDANGNLLYGMHENYQYYVNCQNRNRNMGLFIADRETQGNLDSNRPSSIFTRQNNNGDQYGYECPEERDYYPYWAPSPWKDIAILTQDTVWCSYYQSASQNVQGRGQCMSPTDPTQIIGPIDEVTCNQQGGNWQSVSAFNIAPPDCIQAPFSKDNELGIGLPGYENTYNWTLPTSSQEPCINSDNCNCVLRMRYNISSGLLNVPNSAGQTAFQDGNSPSGNFIDWKYNGDASPVSENMIVNASGMTMQLAMDTTQFGRTFQDRSFVFHIRPRSGANIPPNSRVFNLNVRGKRGNIVQVYPALEYDFVPEKLYVQVGDYIHFQWTGCDTNPEGNAGEGTDQTDRSNIVQLESISYDIPASDEWLSSHVQLFEDPTIRTNMAFINQDASSCESQAELLANNNGNAESAEADVHNCMKLNAAPTPYFDGGVIQMNKYTGESTPIAYMSSRNNNFTNRSQKAVIYVLNFLPTWAIVITVLGGVLFLGAGGVGAATIYAKSHPGSRVAQIFAKM